LAGRTSREGLIPATVARSARIIADISAVDTQDWAELDHDDNPFVSAEFLQALESSGSVCKATGWQPHHLCVYEDKRLVAFAPSYLKYHSHGEFVFDWSWADAYQRHGREYYPKLLTAVPYSPVPGPRLLVQRGHPQADMLRRELIQLARAQCEQRGLSSWHCNFINEADLQALRNESLLTRSDWQFHWFNQGYRSFDDFLATLRSKKRKNIRRDRRIVEQNGIRFMHRSGADLLPGELDFVITCYRQTFLEYGNHPALTPAFFATLVARIPGSILVVLAFRDEQPLAMSFFLVGGGRLYGRYWGCTEQVPGLHFETTYHQGIEYCIRHGLQVFEPGAQGEHKISRGFEPIRTSSCHLVRDPLFRTAIADYLQKEQHWLEQYRQQLTAHMPFRVEDPR